MLQLINFQTEESDIHNTIGKISPKRRNEFDLEVQSPGGTKRFILYIYFSNGLTKKFTSLFKIFTGSPKNKVHLVPLISEKQVQSCSEVQCHSF